MEDQKVEQVFALRKGSLKSSDIIGDTFMPIESFNPTFFNVISQMIKSLFDFHGGTGVSYKKGV